MDVFTLSLLLVALAQSPEAAPSTAEGVEALLRGDYVRAVAVLKPRAQHQVPKDGAAQFFMAMMYEQGLGVERDYERAYALYSLSTMASRHAFSLQAEFAGERLSRELPPSMIQTALTMASTGVWDGLEPGVIHLEPGQWIEVERFGATIVDKGRQQPAALVEEQPHGAVFLPLRHTPLEVRQDDGRVVRRHMLDIFAWWPSSTADGVQTWSLAWTLFEINGTQITPLDHEEALMAHPSLAPPSAGFAARRLVRLGVDEKGRGWWSVRVGANARRERLPASVATSRDSSRPAGPSQ